ncbi:MAG: energy-coupled thiamine transporter ThiT [Faecalibacterium prausnitzii]
MSKTYSKTRILVECALMIAIGTVLSNIKFFTMPNGGSITLLSMLPFVLVSFRHGAKWGLFTGFGKRLPANDAWASTLLPLPPSSTSSVRCCWTMCWPLWHWVWAELFARPFKNRTVGVAVGTLCRRFPALYVQLFVRRAGLGQPE